MRDARAIVRRSTLAVLVFAGALVVAACGSDAGSPAPSSAAVSPKPTSHVLSATSRPTPQAKPSVDPNALAVKVTSWTKSVKRGGAASTTIKTSPGAECGISVLYPDGPSSAKGLDPKKADKKGTWPIDVSCTAGPRTGDTEVKFTVK